MGILDFEEGEIRIDGHSVKEEPLVCKSLLAYIPDNPDLYEHLTGIQYLDFIADIFQIPSAVRTERIGEYAEQFGITESLGDLISSYSHGMKQKLAIISALIHKPRLLVLDEPFVGLDPSASVVLKQNMHALCEEGSAIFFSTHVLDVAEKLCNKIAIIKEGVLVAAGETAGLTQGKSLKSCIAGMRGKNESWFSCCAFSYSAGGCLPSMSRGQRGFCVFPGHRTAFPALWLRCRAWLFSSLPCSKRDRCCLLLGIMRC